MKEIEVENTDKCYICGAKIKAQGNSLHVWDIEYECGCVITGIIDQPDKIFLDNECGKPVAFKPKYRKLTKKEISESINYGDQKFLRHLIDVVWNDVTQSTEVPSTTHADRLIRYAKNIYKN